MDPLQKLPELVTDLASYIGVVLDPAQSRALAVVLVDRFMLSGLADPLVAGEYKKRILYRPGKGSVVAIQLVPHLEAVKQVQEENHENSLG